MQVCLTKIFLVEHQIFAQYATKSWNINPDVREEKSKSLSISQSLHIWLGWSESGYQKSNIKSNRSDIRWRKWERKGTEKGKNLAIHIITLHHTQRIAVHSCTPNHHKKAILFLCIFRFNSYFTKYDQWAQDDDDTQWCRSLILMIPPLNLI